MQKSFHAVTGGRTGNVGHALVKAVVNSVNNNRNPGKVGHAVLTHEARYNRSVTFKKA